MPQALGKGPNGEDLDLIRDRQLQVNSPLVETVYVENPGTNPLGAGDNTNGKVLYTFMKPFPVAIHKLTLAETIDMESWSNFREMTTRLSWGFASVEPNIGDYAGITGSGIAAITQMAAVVFARACFNLYPFPISGTYPSTRPMSRYAEAVHKNFEFVDHPIYLDAYKPFYLYIAVATNVLFNNPSASDRPGIFVGASVHYTPSYIGASYGV